MSEVSNVSTIKTGVQTQVFVPWSVQSQVEQPLIARAQGCWLYDDAGNAYLDFDSQHKVCNLGHCHPRVVAAIQEQAERLCYVSPTSFANDVRIEAARLIAEVAPGNLERVLFTTGGSDANENAIKFARWYTGRDKIITRYRSYHGATHGSMSLGGDSRRWHSEPGIPGIVRVFDPYRYRCLFCKDLDGCNLACLDHVEETIRYEGPDNVAAVFIEGLTGVSGLFIPPPDYLPGLRALCDKYGILLISDEVMSGFGRTGEWFAVDHWDVVPDIITFAKGVTGGHAPLGGVLVSREIGEYFDRENFWSGQTYSGHPLACAAGVAAVNVYKDEGLIENSKHLGRKLLDELTAFKDRHPSIGDVRGLGLFCALELVRDRTTREPLVAWQSTDLDPIGGGGVMREMSKQAWQRGLFLWSKWNIIYIAPPLTITEDELTQGLAIVDDVLSLADEAVA